MNKNSTQVYVLPDSQGRILRCEGGYTTPEDLTGWTMVDEGDGDRYNLCQSNYFEGGLYTEDGIPRWKLAEDETAPFGVRPVLRGDEELEADRAALPEPEPSAAEDTAAMLVDHEFRLTLLELGV